MKEVDSVSQDNHSVSPAAEHIIFEIFKTQQRQHRWWRVRFIISTVFILLMGFAFTVKSVRSFRSASAIQENSPVHPHIGLINMKGLLHEGHLFSSKSSADHVVYSLRAAFANPKIVAVILRVNSRGGSGVQAAQIYDEIQYLRQKHPKVPIIAVCDDWCTSGAYWVVSACNQIYANPVSIVGSIGVLSEGMGYVKQLANGGIERRVFKAGRNKDFLDPYRPLNPEHVRIMKSLLSDSHQQFIKAVKVGRGKQLKQFNKNEDVLFSGQPWTGNQALSLGLIDGFGSVYSVTRDQFNMTNLVDYTVQPHFLHQLTSIVSSLPPYGPSSSLNTAMMTSMVS